ncbi:MAG: ATPase, T2SS/T4P/T4SS family, partial [Nitrospinales bacterium]
GESLRLAKSLAGPLGIAVAKLEMEKLASQIMNTAHDIHSAGSIDEIIIEKKKGILRLFNASLITIYVKNPDKNEIYSKVKSGEYIEEIRLPISAKSIAGFVASSKKMVNVRNVYDREELSRLHPDLWFDDSWDKKTGFKSKSMLVCPLLHNQKLMGVLQLINKKNEELFSLQDERNAHYITRTLALAFFNQKEFLDDHANTFSGLPARGVLTEEELEQTLSKARDLHVEVEDLLLNELGLKRETLGQSLEEFYQIPYFGFKPSIQLPPNVLSGLSKSYLLKNHWLPLKNDDWKAVILIDDPRNRDKIRNIRLLFPKKDIQFKVGLKADIRDFLNSLETEEDACQSEPTEVSALLDSYKKELEMADKANTPAGGDEAEVSESAIVQLANKTIIDAYVQGASDIHIEPGVGNENMQIRFRKDGMCRVYQELPFLCKSAFISRIKIMANLNIAEKRLPQDGKIKIKHGKGNVELRVATCPTVGGNEDVVLRILAANKPKRLEQMNFSERTLALIKESISKPYGLILAVGPTGSGKTTTLHSCLGHINVPEKKIWAVEDPVEITQKGLRQVQVQSKIGLNFACAMRFFLRGDPDVIMVGEMRDVETCKIALEASLTGHLVFSTLHTNSAPETVTRLIDMGMDPINFADALLLVVAQRLVRTLCKHCKQPYHPSGGEFDGLAEQYGKDLFPKLGIKYTPSLTLYRPRGCEICDNTGYSGRTGLYEALQATPVMKRLIMKKALMEEVRGQAIRDGMTTLKQDGVWKVFKGETDLKQVLTVCMV